MSKTAHRIYIGIFVVLAFSLVVYLIAEGASYYGTSLEERFYHDDHQMLKPSGPVGHGPGIFGTFCMIIGVSSYMTRKRIKRFRSIGKLKYWLEFHIFLCTIGPIMVLFHTAFKFGGIVSISFWSMVGVVVSGVIGRFIYIQIPRTINGRELSLQEVREMRENVEAMIKSKYNFSEDDATKIMQTTNVRETSTSGSWVGSVFRKTMRDWQTVRNLKSVIKSRGLSRVQRKQLLGLVREEISLNNRIDRLQTMRKLFKYWHVAHLPFALIMLIIMVVHVAVTLAFGYKWIF
jgi:hypothetical protein